MAGYVAISGQITQVPTGTVNIGPITIAPNTVPDYSSTLYNLTTATQITIPSWAAGIIIDPASSNTIGLTLKGGTGDTGITLNPSGVNLLTFPSSPQASFWLMPATSAGVPVQISYF